MQLYAIPYANSVYSIKKICSGLSLIYCVLSFFMLFHISILDEVKQLNVYSQAWYALSM